MCVYHIFFIHMLTVGLSPYLVLVDNAASNVEIKVSIWDTDLVSFGYTRSCEIALSYVLCLILIEDLHNVFYIGCTNLLSQQQFLYSFFPPWANVIFLLLDNCFNTYEMIITVVLISIVVFISCFWTPFKLPVGYLYIFNGKLINPLCNFYYNICFWVVCVQTQVVQCFLHLLLYLFCFSYHMQNIS